MNVLAHIRTPDPNKQNSCMTNAVQYSSTVVVVQ